MNLNELSPAEGSKKERRRIGRGHGTGWGKTAGKGHNGQKQRSGKNVSAAFEGGQLPLVRRVPKRGFSNKSFKKDIIVLNLKDIVEKFEDNAEISLQTLADKKVLKNISFIKKYEDEGLRNTKGRKQTKEYMNTRIDFFEKEKDYKSILKIIGDIEVSKKLVIKTHRISKAAKESVEKAGGTVELLEIRSYANKAGNVEKNKSGK